VWKMLEILWQWVCQLASHQVNLTLVGHKPLINVYTYFMYNIHCVISLCIHHLYLQYTGDILGGGGLGQCDLFW
jgi:hypothetical protein